MEHAGIDGADARYEDAIRFCADGILRLLWGEKMINKIFGRATQSHAAGLAIVMHFEALEGLGQRPTLALIQAQIGSPRTLSAFFALLRWAGFVQVEIDQADRRNQYLVPTGPLIEGVKAWMLHHLRCCEIMGLVPADASDRLRADAASFGALMARSRRLIELARRPAPGTAWAWFDEFDCGDRIALLLLREHCDVARTAEAPGAAWFHLDGRGLASHLGISHSHIRNVINRAEEHGFLRQDRHRHLIALSGRMIDDVRMWFTTFWAALADAAGDAESARRDVPVPAPGGVSGLSAGAASRPVAGRDGPLPGG